MQRFYFKKIDRNSGVPQMSYGFVRDGEVYIDEVKQEVFVARMIIKKIEEMEKQEKEVYVITIH